MKRLSNKKYLLNPILWTVVAVWVVVFSILLVGCATTKAVAVDQNPPFCQVWNALGDEPNGEPVTPAQRKMFHLGYFLSKSNFVRITLNEHYDNSLFVDKVVTCYEEHIIFLVEEVDGICACSVEDKKDELSRAFSNYLNDCVREVKTEK